MYLISNLYSEYIMNSYNNNKRTNNPNKKWINYLNRHFVKNIQMANTQKDMQHLSHQGNAN